MYDGARYYDRQIGAFISPDTLVPDPTNVYDYNRYMYVRGNPLRYSDPTGYYSDDEIMLNYGCENWACVEAIFQQGGPNAGLWGWLYILQQAQDGDTVVATMINQAGNHSMVGVFGRDGQGKIFVTGTDYLDPTGGMPFSAMISENGFATFAAADGYGIYELHRMDSSLATGRDQKHNYLYIDPITQLKAGATLGPIIARAAPL